MDNHDAAYKWKRRKRGFLCISFYWWQKITTGCAAVYSCGGWCFWVFLRFVVLTSNGTWRNNCNSWPCTILYLYLEIRFLILHLEWVICAEFFMITEYHLSWKKKSPKMECSCSIKELFGLIWMFFANYGVIFNALKDIFNCRKLSYIFFIDV